MLASANLKPVAINTTGATIVMGADLSTHKKKKAFVSGIIINNPGLKFSVSDTLPAPVATGRPFANLKDMLVV